MRWQGVGGEYPAGSTSAGEAANEKMLLRRGPGTDAHFPSVLVIHVSYHSLHHGHELSPQCLS